MPEDCRQASVARLPVVIALALSLILCIAADALALTDAPGSKDHLMVKRFEGSIIIGYDFRSFDEFVLLLGPAKGMWDPIMGVKNEQGQFGGSLTPVKSQAVEGQVTRILYAGPKGRSPLEIVRNYEQELQKNGFQTLFKCGRADCQVIPPDSYGRAIPDGLLGNFFLYPSGRRLSNTPRTGSSLKGEMSEDALRGATGQQFLAAKRASPQGDAYVSVYVANGGWKSDPETFEHPIILLDVVVTVPMENKMVTVDAATMAKEVGATGHIALYGIYFDTDKADIKPESSRTIGEIAAFLKSDPKVVVYVVGHTDNVGGYDHNMGLSQRRAEAVVKELTTRHSIPAARLKAAGTGPLAPVGPNDTEEGRAKNRRVELVRQ